MYLDVPVNPKSYMFRDNKAVVDNPSIPTSVASKRSHLDAYYQVREVIAAGYLLLGKDGKSNPLDILGKCLGFSAIWPLLQPIFWHGDGAGLGLGTNSNGSDKIPSKHQG